MCQSVRVLARLARVLERADDELSLPQYRVLLMVSAGDERASLLASRLALAKPTITAVVDGLVERGYLQRSEVVGDRRAVRLQVTKPGRVAIATAERAMSERLATVFGRLPDAALVHAALASVSAALDSAVAERVAGEPVSR